MEKCSILNVDINAINMEKTIDNITQNMNQLKGKYICVSNVHTTIMAYEDSDYLKIQNSAYLRLPDGNPLAKLCNKRGYKKCSRVTGPDLMEEIFKVSEKKGYTHFFYGSTDDTLVKMKNKLQAKYPSLKVSGIYSPPFRELSAEEDEQIIEMINKEDADFLWVGLGAPKQEIWMYNHQNKVNSLMIGVGAGFDYMAENIKRAPKFMQKLSLEWLYRLLQDPKKLWKRYLVTNCKFIYLIFVKRAA